MTYQPQIYIKTEREHEHEHEHEQKHERDHVLHYKPFYYGTATQFRRNKTAVLRYQVRLIWVFHTNK